VRQVSVMSHFEGADHAAVDPTTGTIWCEGCSDATYPDSFDSLFRLTRIRVEEENDQSMEQSLLGGGKARGRGAWRGWEGEGMPVGGITKNCCRGECELPVRQLPMLT
jgi:ubiquitin carboxyl-terminal hydrolase 22/27/51